MEHRGATTTGTVSVALNSGRDPVECRYGRTASGQGTYPSPSGVKNIQ